MVSPNAQLGANPALPVVGVLANDLMSNLDVEIDFAAHKINYFSTDHCEGKVIYWPAAAIAVVPYRTSRTGRNPSPLDDSHIRVPVTFDGKQLIAVIDTGASRTTLSEQVARDLFHVTADSPGSVPLGTVANDPEHKVFDHVFDGLTFDGVTVSHPRVVVFPDLVGSKDPNNRLRTGDLIRKVDDDIGPELTIGMDILRKLHLYVACREHKLYITSSAPTVAAEQEP